MRKVRHEDSEKERVRGGRGAMEKSAGRVRGGETKTGSGKARESEQKREREQSVRAPIHLEFH